MELVWPNSIPLGIKTLSAVERELILNRTSKVNIQTWSQGKKEWNRILYSNDFASTLQDYAYGECKANAGSSILRLVWSSLSGEVIAIGQAALKRYGGVGVMHFPRGPVFANDPDDETVHAICKSLRQYCKTRIVMVAKISPNLRLHYFPWYVSVTEKSGARRAWKPIIHERTSRVNLNDSLAEILSRFEGRTRYSIRKTDYSRLQFRASRSQEMVERFYEVYKRTASRANFRGHSISYLKKFICGQNEDFARVFEVQEDGVTVASALILARETLATYLLGGSIKPKGKFSPGVVLHWYIMQQLHQDGVKCYDLQGIPASPEKGKDGWGVYLFKRGFRGEEVALVPEFDITPYPWLNQVVAAGCSAKSRFGQLRSKASVETKENPDN